MTEGMTPCQHQTVSETPPLASNAEAAVCVAGVGEANPELSLSSLPSSDRTDAPTPAAKGTATGGMKDRLKARLQKAVQESDGETRFPLDENWYVRWDGNNWDLVEVRLPDPNSPLTKNLTTPKHIVRSYCGAHLDYAISLYTQKRLQDSGVKTAELVLAELTRINTRLAQIAELLKA